MVVLPSLEGLPPTVGFPRLSVQRHVAHGRPTSLPKGSVEFGPRRLSDIRLITPPVPLT